LITCTVHVAVALVKLALIVTLVLLTKLHAFPENVPPLVRSTSVAVHPDAKLAPLIVRVCGLVDPGTGSGLVLVMVGATATASRPIEATHPSMPPAKSTLHQV